jgi:hypothetical protein
MPGNVLRRNAGSAARKSFVVALYFAGCEFALWMSEEVRAIAGERKHDEQFRVHARGGNPRGRQPFDCCV